jgi:hypothetical protein
MHSPDKTESKDEMIEFKIDQQMDTKYLDGIEELQQEDVKTVTQNQPSDVISVEIRLREGARHKGDKFVLDGIETYIPQLSFLDIRRATREGIKIFDKTEFGKKILYSKRRVKDDDELFNLMSFEERQIMRGMTDVEDLWIVWFALRDVLYPKITGDFEKDRCWIEYLPRDQLETFIDKLRRFNGMEASNSANPSGEEDIKSFPDDGLGNGIQAGDS